MKKNRFLKEVRLNKTNLDNLLRQHMLGTLYLTPRQIDHIINIRGERKYLKYDIINNRQVIVNE